MARRKNRAQNDFARQHATAAERRDAEWVLLVVIVLATFVAYLPSRRGDFLWDDDAHVTRPALRSIDGLYRIWFDLGATQQYYPLLHSAFWVEHRLWGDNPIGYHLLNVSLHATAACLVYLILKRLRTPGAILAAAIFALHPVHVESVAWIAEQKNTLSAVFYLAAMLVYLDFDDSRRTSVYAIALGLFVLGLLTKTVTATLPAALLVIFWWKRGQLNWRRDVLPLVPFFVLGAVGGITTAWVERKLIGAEGSSFELSLLSRCLLAGRVPWFYLSKLIWPVNLAFIYPRWTIDPAVWWQWLFLLATIAVTVALWLFRGKVRGPLAGWLFFVGTLAPVLGFLNVYPFLFSFVADHFQYLASLGIIVVVAAGIGSVLPTLTPTARGISTLACVLIVTTLGILTWNQNHLYANRITLYSSTLERNPNCWLAYNNLGVELSRANETAKANEYYQQALRLNPNYAQAHNNLGVNLADLGKSQEAVEHYQQAIQLNENYAAPHYNLGVVLGQAGQFSEAAKEFETTLRLQPDHAEACANLATLYDATHRPEEVVPTALRALELARSQNRSELAQQIESWLNDYRANQNNGSPKPPKN